VNWSEILRKGSVPEPPGYHETVKAMQKKRPMKKAKKEA